MKRKNFLQTLGGGAAAAVLPAAKAAPAAKPKTDLPNIVIIMTDQQRADFTKLAGFPLDTQPFLDSLAQQGTRFPHAYTTDPVCAPARCSLFTGRFPKAHRVRENNGIRHCFYTRDLADVLRDKGYRLALCGKNHSHLQAKGFDTWRPYGHWDGAPGPNAAAVREKEFARWLLELVDEISTEPTPFPLEAQHPYRMVTDAIQFVEATKDQPWFLWLSFPEPHNPYQVPKPYWDMFPPDAVPDRAAGAEALENRSFKWRWQRQLLLHYIPNYESLWRRVRSNYCGMLRLIDDQVKRFVEYLDKSGRMDNTVIVFVADHGDFMGDYGLHKKGVELPECLVRVPMIWVGAGIQSGRPHHPACVSLADVMPTLCDMLGVDLPEGVQGRSLWPLLQGRPHPEAEFRSMYAEGGVGGLFFEETDTLDFDHPVIKRPVKNIFDELNSYSQSGTIKMVRMGDWKLVFDMMGNGQLYNLKSDPAELRNRFNDPSLSAVQMQMMQELLAWTLRTEDVLPTNRYIHKWAERNWYAPHRVNPT
ncbi:MAG: sulfatase-like hydrolase/transferase [Candidatus Sumerlaeia bacterium]|nr:sulfatase-like hydrolase/transferase [Candidatus Sumerlaeia bacterium]